MKKLFWYSICSILITASFYCTNKKISNSTINSVTSEQRDTHKLYEHHSHAFPRQPTVNDSVVPPEFIGGFDLCKDTLYTQLRQLYIKRKEKIYTNILFSLKIDKNGNATEYHKSHVVTLDESFENEFIKIYPLVLNNVKMWKPARLKRNNEATEYVVYVEIESKDGSLIYIEIRNMNYEKLYNGHF